MAEILEQIKKMSREEQLALADQIYALAPEQEAVEDEEFMVELHRRADNAVRNPHSGTSWAEAKARLTIKQEE